MPDQPPRYLLVASNFPPVVGGSSTVYQNLCAVAGGALGVLTARRDYRTRRPHDEAEAADAGADYPITRVELVRPELAPAGGRRPPLPLRLASDLGLMVRVLITLRGLLRRHRYRAVIVGELIYGGWIGLAARYLFRRPYLVYVHGEELAGTGAGLSERLKGLYLRQAAAVVAVSRFTRQTLIERFALAPERIACIPNGVDARRFGPRPAAEALTRRYRLAGKKVFVSVGRLIPRKGFDMTLRALPRVLEAEPLAHYLIVGEGPSRGPLERLAAELRLRDHVSFCGQVGDDELAEHYALGRVFVMANRRMPDGDTEGFGLVFLEANACGLPVIAGRAGGTGDAVSDGENGLVVDGTDIDAIAGAMLRLLRDEDLYRTLRRKGLERAGKSDWEARWRELSALLARILNS